MSRLVGFVVDPLALYFWQDLFQPYNLAIIAQTSSVLNQVTKATSVSNPSTLVGAKRQKRPIDFSLGFAYKQVVLSNDIMQMLERQGIDVSPEHALVGAPPPWRIVAAPFRGIKSQLELQDFLRNAFGEYARATLSANERREYFQLLQGIAS